MSESEPSLVGDQLAAAVLSGDATRVAEVASRQIYRLFTGHYAELIQAVHSLPPSCCCGTRRCSWCIPLPAWWLVRRAGSTYLCSTPTAASRVRGRRWLLR